MTHLDLQGEKIGLSVERGYAERINWSCLCQAKLDGRRLLCSQRYGDPDR